MIRLLRSIALGALVAACGLPGATTSPESPAVPTGAAIQLRQAPPNLGCDTVGVDYRQVTFEIDPAAADPVTALTDTGKVLRTFWSADFRGSAADKTVLDPTGAVVAADGEVLAIPEGAFPRLHGYFVCPSSDTLYILIADPV